MAETSKDENIHESIQSHEFAKLEDSVRQPISVISTEDFVEPKDLYDELIKRVKIYHPNADIGIIKKAYDLACKSHSDQKRKSGEPYIIHPLNVAIILADLEMDKETIVAGLLHDVVEDTEVTMQQIEQEFGKEIANLVGGVTKLGKLSYTSDTVEIQAENLRKMFLAMAKDIRVIIIKLADRLHNLRTLKFMSPEKQRDKALETIEIYAPLAQRLGISKIKSEIDDLAFKYSDPKAYYSLVEKIALKKRERDEYVDLLVNEVRKSVENAGIKAEVSGRAKHFLSIYRKMINQNKSIDQIYDLFAIRIIVENLKDCYGTLGVIHEMYTPIPGRFKDYIAMPKPNMYQSLHTSVIGPKGTPFEIQIRTRDMHRTSEYGIAAHWKYKESGEGSTVQGEEEKLAWLRQILEWQQDMSDNREFVNLLKNDLDLFSDSVFCFTPNGEIKNLPQGSTPIDFAYSIHSAVGNRMVGAKVNDRLVPINYQIKNGDRIEIITSNNAKGPSRDWISLVKSAQAKNKINQFFRSINKTENITKGKELFNEAAKQKGYDLQKLCKPKYQEKILKRYGFHNWDALMASIGQGSCKEGQVLNRLNDMYQIDHPLILSDEEIIERHRKKEREEQRPLKQSKSGVLVRGLYDVSVRLSKCCNPVPGDEIVGFVTRGRGVSVHRTDCINVISLPQNELSRMIDVEWENEDTLLPESTFRAELHIYANDRLGLLNDIVHYFSENKIDIHNFNTRLNKNGIVTAVAVLNIKNRNEIQKAIDKIKQIESVIDVERSVN